jgi:hypothetical protein
VLISPSFVSLRVENGREPRNVKSIAEFSVPPARHKSNKDLVG